MADINAALPATGAVASANHWYNASYAPAKAIDSNGGTAWGCGLTPVTAGTWWVDLGAAYTIRSVRCVQNGSNSAYRASAYNLDYSDNGVDWTTLLNVTVSAADEYYSIDPTLARYWRLDATAGGANDWQLFTVELWGYAGQAPSSGDYSALLTAVDGDPYTAADADNAAHNHQATDAEVWLMAGILLTLGKLDSIYALVNAIQTNGVDASAINDHTDLRIDGLETILATDVGNIRDDVGVANAPSTGLMAALETKDANDINRDTTNTTTITDAIAGLEFAAAPTVEEIVTAVDAAHPSDVTNATNTITGEIEEATAAIRGVPASDLKSILEAIQAIPTTNVAGLLGDLADAIANLDGDLSSAQTAVLNAIAGITFASGWPGLANVTVDPPVALSNGLVLAGPMDGVLVNITTPPTKTGVYVIGDTYYDYKEGLIAFETDNGYVEMWQYLGFRQAIYVPKSMQSAANCHIQLLAGAQGTVAKWHRA